jgi:hypothetical protein
MVAFGQEGLASNDPKLVVSLSLFQMTLFTHVPSLHERSKNSTHILVIGTNFHLSSIPYSLPLLSCISLSEHEDQVLAVA